MKYYFPFKIIRDIKRGEAQIQITYKKEEKKYYPKNIISMSYKN